MQGDDGDGVEGGGGSSGGGGRRRWRLEGLSALSLLFFFFSTEIKGDWEGLLMVFWGTLKVVESG